MKQEKHVGESLSGSRVLVLNDEAGATGRSAVEGAGGQPLPVSLEDAVEHLLGSPPPAVLFSTPRQVGALLDQAGRSGRRTPVARALGKLRLVAASAEVSAALRQAGQEPALEGGGAEPGRLRPPPAAPDVAVADAVFLQACRREPVPHTPVWLMRQAGRYMAEYRAIRAKLSMLELCKSPDLVSEVTVHAAGRLGVDAAILFADLLLVVEPLGLRLEYRQGEGPVISPAVRDSKSIDGLREVEPAALDYVYAAVRRTRADLPAHIPLIGFAGAPFTVASYLVEGGASRSFQNTKSLMYRDEGAWHALMEKVVRATTGYLLGQVEAGVQALQIFDSWVGALAPADYRRYAQPHTAALIRSLPAAVPLIHFGTGTGALLEEMQAAGGSVIGLDWRVELDAAWARLGHSTPVMGNLDPLVLFGGADVIEREVRRILEQAGRRPGHIFNLGHGILPGTPVDAVIRLVELVHEISGSRP
jgi:uroporphyrinogen decarboxylase